MTIDVKAVSFDTAVTLVQAGSVTSATIKAIGGKYWSIILRGRNEFVLKSDRLVLRRFATLETALGEIQKLGLRRAEIDFERWER